MARIRDVLRRLLPQGSTGRGELNACPVWPPDVFAVAATLVEAGGLYARSEFIDGWETGERLFNGRYADRVRKFGWEWAQSGAPPREVKGLWRDLVTLGTHEVGGAAEDGDWQASALELMSTADEASLGFGFVPADMPDSESSLLAWNVMNSMQQVEDHGSAELLPHLPNSLCQLVPPSVACVQPKTNVPAVGCTLRSLSHNLALLPCSGIVETKWLFNHPKAPNDGPLNLLLVPFPYVIRGRDFRPVPDHSDTAADHEYFCVDPGWMRRRANEGEAGGPVSAEDVAQFLERLLERASQEVNVVHGIVLPECSLLREQTRAVADILAAKVPELELFIAGVLPSAPLCRNLAFNARISRGSVLRTWQQGKHHRWRLDRDQIGRYHLGHVLDPGRDWYPGTQWWEQIRLSPRECSFSVIRRDASLAVLICEDLARFDPVLPVINAVGPNLVVALLMDGPQLEKRWPGRYATVLADDPGSSVLTLTSIGMIRRSAMPGGTDRRAIALWKEPGQPAKELDLGPKEHAMLVTLSTSTEPQVSLDGRPGGYRKVRFRLTAVRGVAAPDADWPELA